MHRNKDCRDVCFAARRHVPPSVVSTMHFRVDTNFEQRKDVISSRRYCIYSIIIVITTTKAIYEEWDFPSRERLCSRATAFTVVYFEKRLDKRSYYYYYYYYAISTTDSEKTINGMVVWMKLDFRIRFCCGVWQKEKEIRKWLQRTSISVSPSIKRFVCWEITPRNVCLRCAFAIA